jgi:hypothetical protein
MKKTVVVMLVLMLLNLCVPAARAEISQDLDPMVPVEYQATVTEEASVSGATTGQADHGVTPAAGTIDKIKKEKPSKEKTKKRCAVKKSKRSNSKNSSKDKKGPH